MKNDKSALHLIISFSVFAYVLFSTNLAFAAPDAGTMLQNFAMTVPQLMHLVTAFAYIAGIVFIIKGIIELKRFGEARTMMSSEKGIAGPITFVIVGTLLLYLPSAVQIGTSTFWTSATPFSYVINPDDPWQAIIHAAYLIVQLTGTIAFIRGLILLTSISERGQQGTFGRAMAYIIAGILCINIYPFIQVINNTLSLGQS